LISLDSKGKRIDLHATLQQQSIWSSRAALAAGAASILGVIAVYNP
jgi:hypothetical protein